MPLDPGPSAPFSLVDTVLESAEARLELSPDSGSPHEWVNKRSGASFLSDPGSIRLSLAPLEEGASLQSRLQPGIEDDPDRLWLAAAASDGSWSFHIRFELRDDGFEMDWRILNRTEGSLKLDSGLWVSSPGLDFERSADGWSIFNAQGDEWFGIGADGLVAGEPRSGSKGVFLPFGAKDGLLGPRQNLTGSVLLAMHRGLGRRRLESSGASLFVKKSALVVLPSENLPQAKLSVLRSDGQEVHAVVDFYAGAAAEFDHASIGGIPSRVALCDTAGEMVFELDLARMISPSVAAIPQTPARAATTEFVKSSSDAAGQDQAAEFELSADGTSIAGRGRAAALRTKQAFREGRYGDAARFAEQQLLYNGDDPLAWWELGMARRLDCQEDADAMANAHFIAPFEPVLRAEGFLSAPLEGAAEAHPLVGAIASQFTLMLVPALDLIDRGLWSEASRWLEECIRADGNPRLSLLAAWCWLNGTTKTAHAAQIVATVLKEGLPTDLTHTEAKILAELKGRLPTLAWE